MAKQDSDTTVRLQLLDELLKEYKRPEDLLGEQGILKQLTKALVERCLQAEMTEHLGYGKHASEGRGSGNSRNGHGKKTIVGEFGEAEIAVPRDRRGNFEPVLVPKGQSRFTGFDDKIIALYARGMTTREIQGHLQEAYGVEISPTLVSNVTDAVLDEIKAWQARPLEAIYPIVYFDALFFKVREGNQIQNKAVYVALGINMEGKKELLGLWLGQTEGAKFWLGIFNELKTRGLQDILIAAVDGLTGLCQALESVYPQTQVQLCTVHKVRSSLRYVLDRDRREVTADLRAVYTAATVELAEQQLEVFGNKWRSKYPVIYTSWKEQWSYLIPCFGYPPEIRRVIYTTNAIESMNRSIRKITKNRGSFPNDDAVMKLVYLALRNAAKRWTNPIPNWKGALNQFSILFPDRMPKL
jgi:putative transposase